MEPFCSGCDSTHDAADCPHRAVLAPGTAPVSLRPVPVAPRDEDWDREKGRWI